MKIKDVLKNRRENQRKPLLKRKQTREKFLGSASEIKKRIEAVYGTVDNEEKVRMLQTRNRRKYTAILMIGMMIMLVTIAGMVSSGEGVVTDGDGFVVALERPENIDSVKKQTLAVRDAKSGKELAAGTVRVLPEKCEIGGEKVGSTGNLLQEDEAAFEETRELQSKSRAAKRALSDVDVSTQGALLKLPEALSDGTEIVFQRKVGIGNFFMAVMAIIVACLYIYSKRYNDADREIAMARESVLRELPDFINKMVLLLEAGLVVTSAFDKILEKPKNDSYFYQQLLAVQSGMKQTNSSFDREFVGFARRIGIRELIRTSNIIGDNLDKGAELSEKLMGEGNLLWHERKKAVEEKGRVAETKLTFPLMILLIVLIMITIAPAMMEM